MAKLTKLQQEWLKELRSGERRQGFGFLYSVGPDSKSEGFCCLGVLCDIACDDWWVYEEGRQIYKLAKSKAFQIPDDETLKKIGLTKEEAVVVAKMNDLGCTFNEIADYLERRWKVVRK